MGAISFKYVSYFAGKGRRSSGCSIDSWSSYDSLDEDEALPHPRSALSLTYLKEPELFNLIQIASLWGYSAVQLRSYGKFSGEIEPTPILVRQTNHRFY